MTQDFEEDNFRSLFLKLFSLKKRRLFCIEIFDFFICLNRSIIDLESFDSLNQIWWIDSQIARLLCSLCFFVVYPPMQMSCCGTRICELCSKKYYYYFIQLNKVDKQIFSFRIDKSFQCYWCGSSDCQV
jgi:hypothetical protein